ncbi:MAG: hypothetical protein P4L22_03545 [Candidatus Babeliales bacterium]|nr:hypothetical protein [Candidatus Babeliales bacterium]
MKKILLLILLSVIMSNSLNASEELQKLVTRGQILNTSIGKGLRIFDILKRINVYAQEYGTVLNKNNLGVMFHVLADKAFESKPIAAENGWSFSDKNKFNFGELVIIDSTIVRLMINQFEDINERDKVINQFGLESPNALVYGIIAGEPNEYDQVPVYFGLAGSFFEKLDIGKLKNIIKQ